MPDHPATPPQPDETTPYREALPPGAIPAHSSHWDKLLVSTRKEERDGCLFSMLAVLKRENGALRRMIAEIAAERHSEASLIYAEFDFEGRTHRIAVRRGADGTTDSIEV